MMKTRVGWRAGAMLVGVAWVLGACSGEDAIVGSRGSSDDDAGGAGAGATDPGATPGPSVNFWVTQLSEGPGRCLPEALPQSAEGELSCKVFSFSSAMGCSCDAAGRAPAADGARSAVLSSAREQQFCGTEGAPACEDACVCELSAATGQGLNDCRAGGTESGWCYVSPDEGLGDPALVADCPNLGEPRTSVRAIAVASGESAFLACSDAKEAPRRELPLGSTCVPTDELDPSFHGFSPYEVTIDTASASCASGVCVVQGFQGRVSCPMGSPADQQACRLPGTGKPVTVEVLPQLVDRPPSVASTCSCRCAGPGDGPFCECGAGQVCRELVADLGLPGDLSAGSYCVPDAPPSSSVTTCANAPQECQGGRDY